MSYPPCLLYTSFVVKTMNPGRVVAVDFRYHDSALNGGVKTKSQGEKVGYPWCSDWRAVQRAKTVLIVESAINALSAETAIDKAEFLKGWACIATVSYTHLDVYKRQN